MVYFSSNSQSPAAVAGGPQTYQNPYYTTSCGCGSGNTGVTMAANYPVREGFSASHEGMQQARGPAPAGQPMPAPVMTAPAAAPMCTLTATAPPAGCCHPAPLHCDCCNGSGFFRASEAYGS